MKKRINDVIASSVRGTISYAILPFVLGAVISALAFVSLQMVSGVQAAPPLAPPLAPPPAPTPISNLVSSDKALNVTWLSVSGVVTNGNTTSRQLNTYEWVDIQSTIDQSTTNNLTITAQFSNDDSNWDSGPSFVANNSADATDITRLPIFGRYMRFSYAVTGTDRVTITLIGLAK